MPSVTLLLDTIAAVVLQLGQRRAVGPVVGCRGGRAAGLRPARRVGVVLRPRLSVSVSSSSSRRSGPGRPRPRSSSTWSTSPRSSRCIEYMCDGGRISLDEVRAHPGGALFPEPPVVVGAKDPDWTARLDVGNADMMGDLDALLDLAVDDDEDDLPFRMVTRRLMHRYNSSMEHIESRARRYNPAFIHPEDLAELGLAVRRPRRDPLVAGVGHRRRGGRSHRPARHRVDEPHVRCAARRGGGPPRRRDQRRPPAASRP